MENLDKKVQELVDIVEAKKAKIEKLERPQYKTNLSLPIGFLETERINLQIVNDPVQLMKYLAYLWSQSVAFNTLCAQHDFKLKYIVGGFPVEDWQSDILTRINVVNIKSEKEDLKKKEELLSSLLSPEEIRRIKIERLEKELKG